MESSLTGGSGTYWDDEGGVLRASLAGNAVEKGGVITIQPPAMANSSSSSTSAAVVQPLTRDLVIAVSSVVTGRVVRINMNQATVDILTVDGNALREWPRGAVRREDVRLSALDSLQMQECFLPGDIIAAKVISLGDARAYYLSTAAAEYGVTSATSTEGNPLVPVSWDRMVDSVTKRMELRKVAKPESKVIV